MEPLLRYFITTYQIFGLYYGPPQTLRDLARWHGFYGILLTISALIYSALPILSIVLKGLNSLYSRVGNDSNATRMFIASLRPISTLAMKGVVILYCLAHFQIYLMLLTKGKRLIACLDSNHYHGFDSSKRNAALIVALWGLDRAWATVNYSNNYSRLLDWSLGVVYSLFKTYHFYFFYTVVAYFLIVTNRCLRREHEAIHPHASLTTIMFGVRRVEDLSKNCDRFNSIASSSLIIYCLHMIIQVTFNLSYCVFQKKQNAIFTYHLTWQILWQCTLLAFISLLASSLSYHFDRFHRQVGLRLNCAIRRRRLRVAVKDLQIYGYRVEALLLDESRPRLQLRIFHVCPFGIEQFIQAGIFSFNMAILLYQTEFP